MAAVSSVYLPLSFPRAAKRPLDRRSRIALRSLSIFSLTIKHCQKKKNIKIESPKKNQVRFHYAYLWWMNANRCVGAVGLFPLDTFNVDDKLLSVDLDHFADCIALVVTTNNLQRLCTHIKILLICTLWILTWTSSSLRIGMVRTLYFCFSSFDRGADISFLRMCDGALKWRLRFLLRSDVTCLLNFILMLSSGMWENRISNSNTAHSKQTKMCVRWE